MKRIGEFYVGYQAKAPAGIALGIKLLLASLLCLVVVVALVLSASQAPLGAGKFEFRNYREFTGIILAEPYPRLLVERPGETPDQSSYSSWLLVAPFKFGADELIAGHVGEKVTLQGALIYRDGQTMLELLPDSISTAKPPAPFAGRPAEVLGQVRLNGEIVDSKCYLGVMKPGNAKTHRACAVRCISGGVPPLLVVRTPAGNRSYYQLVDVNGAPVNQRILDKIAVPVQISGELVRYDDTLVLKAPPESYTLL